ncbi:MAG: hypothetical protein ACKERG_04480 [Candidatus Hodgkinia cicadicola]
MSSLPLSRRVAQHSLGSGKGRRAADGVDSSVALAGLRETRGWCGVEKGSRLRGRTREREGRGRVCCCVLRQCLQMVMLVIESV